MPVTQYEELLAKDTVELLEKHAQNIAYPVPISPERMAAFQASMRMRMNVNVNGVNVQLVEDAEAPDLEIAIAGAAPKPAVQPAAAGCTGAPCSACQGSTVVLSNGDDICITCRRIRSAEPKPFSSIMLASERESGKKRRKH
jgi:hypothetical protein